MPVCSAGAHQACAAQSSHTSMTVNSLMSVLRAFLALVQKGQYVCDAGDNQQRLALILLNRHGGKGLKVSVRQSFSSDAGCAVVREARRDAGVRTLRMRGFIGCTALPACRHAAIGHPPLHPSHCAWGQQSCCRPSVLACTGYACMLACAIPLPRRRRPNPPSRRRRQGPSRWHPAQRPWRTWLVKLIQSHSLQHSQSWGMR